MTTPQPAPVAVPEDKQRILWLAVKQGALLIVGAINRVYDPDAAAEWEAFQAWKRRQR